MSEDLVYTSKTTIGMKNQLRHAYLGEIQVPVVYGHQGALRAHYGAPADAPILPSTLDHIIAAVGG